MSVSLLPVAQINVPSATIKDLKIAFDRLRENQITLLDFACQVEALIGDLDNLPTANKTTIVDAIIEIVNSYETADADLQAQIDDFLNNIVKFETFTDNGDGSYTWDDDNGSTVTFSIRQESVTDNGNGTFTFSDGDGGSVTWQEGVTGSTGPVDADTLDGLDSSIFYHSQKPNPEIRMGSLSTTNFDGITFDDTTNTYVLKADVAPTGTDTGASVLRVGQLRLTSGSDASATSTNHAFEMEDSAGNVTKFDGNELVHIPAVGSAFSILWANIAQKPNLDVDIVANTSDASAGDISALDENDEILISRNGGELKKYSLNDVKPVLGTPNFGVSNGLVAIVGDHPTNTPAVLNLPTSSVNRVIVGTSLSEGFSSVTGTGATVVNIDQAGGYTTFTAYVPAGATLTINVNDSNGSSGNQAYTINGWAV